MVQSKKFRGVRQRHWGSWVSEIRHPLLKRRVWLGTFETAEEAARAYDEAAVLICGRNAKTNFPVTDQQGNDKCSLSSSPAPSTTTTASLTMRIAILEYGKSAGPRSDSNWVMIVELGKKEGQAQETKLPGSETPEIMVGKEGGGGGGLDEEQRVALQMIEELLNSN
ncbi:hypothetical protein GH714_043732 [Hevea brasiliensis]|uniref:AP2/ERF domain-containing protein n=1 Tax=Hevea brasiliensis TaxID=3981 RepID=A0A6A6K2P0_HEVBR|nr:hypothetical protein GH714_043732 [Hevea brasiliensis]